MITNILLSLFGGLSFLFFFWRRLKEDYPAGQIFSTAFFVFLGILLGNFLSGRFFVSWWFWTGLLGGALGFILGLARYKFRFYESLEAVSVSFLPWMALLFLTDANLNSSIVSLAGFLTSLGLLGLFYLLDIHYKKFTWYKSGRVGFAGISVAGLFFLLRAGVAVFYSNVLTFPGRIEALISGIVAFVFFLIIYNLSKSEI